LRSERGLNDFQALGVPQNCHYSWYRRHVTLSAGGGGCMRGFFRVVNQYYPWR
jgi:hypothetical protein